MTRNSMTTQRIERGDECYPAWLDRRLDGSAPSCLYAIGNVDILQHRLLGLICSIECPGSVVIRTFDAVRELRDTGVAMIGGFHSPMEQECLEILLRGSQPIIVCPAKGLVGLRYPGPWRQALAAGRLLLLSIFSHHIRRTTLEQAMLRNDLVAAMGDAVLVPYASPGGKTATAIARARERCQPVFTFDEEANPEALRLGAQPYCLAKMIAT